MFVLFNFVFVCSFVCLLFFLDFGRVNLVWLRMRKAALMVWHLLMSQINSFNKSDAAIILVQIMLLLSVF